MQHHPVHMQHPGMQMQPLVPVSPHGGGGQAAYAVKKLERDMETLAQSVLKVEADLCRLAEDAQKREQRERGADT